MTELEFDAQEHRLDEPIVEPINYGHLSSKPPSSRQQHSYSPALSSEKLRHCKRRRSHDQPSNIDREQSSHSEEASRIADQPRVSRFKFKDEGRSSRKHRSHRSHHTRNDDESAHRRKRRSHRSDPSSPAPIDDPTAYDDTYLPNSNSAEFRDPEAAFRESLFQAMADDEGAQFWEGVYGQPIPFDRVPTTKMNPDGSLEAMTEEEYAAHMRAEMYKKTHQHLLEEREARKRAKEKAEKEKERLRGECEESERFSRKVEDSLRRGNERKLRMKRGVEWSNRWNDYLETWSVLGAHTSSNIPWPVFSGKQEDVEPKEVEQFFLCAPTGGQPEEADLPRILKLERVRWHPDKVQQKLGGLESDVQRIKDVTAVFQVIDKLWTETKH